MTALTRDPAPKNLMKQGPRDTNEHIINKYTIIDLLRSGALMGFTGYAAYILYLYFNNITASGLDTGSIAYMTANSITYTTIMFCQYANIISRRAGVTESIFSSYLRSNKKLLGAFLIGIICIIGLIYTPVVHEYFRFGPMNIQDWLFPIAGGTLFLSIREGYKYILRQKTPKTK